MPGGRLQRELKKKRPFESPEQEAMLNLLRTNDRFQLRFARLFREHGLTPSQYNVLRILRGEGKPLPCLEIADRMIAAVPGITGLIDRLEAMGLVTGNARPRTAGSSSWRSPPRASSCSPALDGPLERAAREAHRAPHPARAAGADPPAGEGPAVAGPGSKDRQSAAFFPPIS